MENNKQPKRGLGRGLGALIANTEAPPSISTTTSPTGSEPVPPSTLCSLPLAAIQPNPQQPRTLFAEDALQELANSIRTHGILQPLIVTANLQQADQYWLVAGERRWRAAQLAGLETVPALLREASSQQLVEWALIENVQRADLNALEEAAAYQTLVNEFGFTHAEVAERVGKSRSAISNTVRLLNLPLAAQAALTSQKISAGHARVLLALPDQAAMNAALEQVVQLELSVRQTEALITRLLNTPVAVEPEQLSASSIFASHVAALEARFRNALGTRVNLNRNSNGSGRLVVHFYNDDDLENLLQLIAHDDE